MSLLQPTDWLPFVHDFTIARSRASTIGDMLCVSNTVVVVVDVRQKRQEFFIRPPRREWAQWLADCFDDIFYVNSYCTWGWWCPCARIRFILFFFFFFLFVLLYSFGVVFVVEVVAGFSDRKRFHSWSFRFLHFFLRTNMCAHSMRYGVCCFPFRHGGAHRTIRASKMNFYIEIWPSVIYESIKATAAPLAWRANAAQI